VDAANPAPIPFNESEGLFDWRGQRVVDVEDEDSEQLCRLGLARVAADRMDRAGGSDQLSPAR
jgi:hypothetical protein